MRRVPASFTKISLSLILAGLLLPAALFVLGVKAADPLPNGVAAGDTTATEAVLWTRTTVAGLVTFTYATDAVFSSNIMTVTATVTDALLPIKVEITGLSPATPYFYRVVDAAGAAASGRFRTAPADTLTEVGLRFGVSGDWESELAPYVSLRNADERDLDFFVEHGDTIVAEANITTLEAYLLEHNAVYATYHGLNIWADLRASTAILATIDDNDVHRNGFAGGADPASNDGFDNTGDFINETNRYRTALQAFQAYNPLRDEFYGATGDPRTANKRRLYRFRTYGRDAAVFLLDTRSFRDEPLDPLTSSNPFEVLAFLQALFTPNRTLLGEAQLATLKDDLLQAQEDGRTWKFIVC